MFQKSNPRNNDNWTKESSLGARRGAQSDKQHRKKVTKKKAENMFTGRGSGPMPGE
jgi:hypothetical protein